MASATRNLCRSFFQLSRHVPAKRKCYQPPLCHPPSIRQFSVSTRRTDNSSSRNEPQPFRLLPDEDHGYSEPRPSEYLVPATPSTESDFDPQERADYEALSKKDQAKYLGLQNHYKALVEDAHDDEELERIAEQVHREIERSGEAPLDLPSRPFLTRKEIGFWAEEEEDELALTPDDDDNAQAPEEITSVAESELELKREVRQYTRVAAWDMPLLQKFVKPFKAPDHGTPLRFRYTTYMGEFHPSQKKVVVEFCTKDLPNLEEQHRTKLIKLVGVRYNPDTDVVKMSCEKFEQGAQNKRYLGDMVNKLIAEAKTGDMFEDVPVDLRHHKPKRRPLYPEEWKLTSKTINVLADLRMEGKPLLGDGHGRGEMEAPLDGQKTVHEYVMAMSQPERRQPARKVPAA